MANPSVSVVIPTFNRAAVLPESIESVRRQGFEDLEILVCDDGSSDATRDAVAAIIAADARVRWLPGPHCGRPGAVRDRGVRAARGEWIAFQDSDDLWLPDKLTRQMAVARAGASFVYCRAAELRPGGVRRQMTPFRVRREGRMYETLLLYSLIQTPTVLVRRALLLAPRAAEELTLSVAEDYALYLRLAAEVPFHFIDAELVLCRAQPDSISADTLAGLEEVEQALRAALARTPVAPPLAALALARVELRRYKQLLLRNAPRQRRLEALDAALRQAPGMPLAQALRLAERVHAAGLVRRLVASGIAGPA